MTRSPEEEVMQKVLAAFNPDSFLLAEYEEAGETERTLLPQGEIKIETIRDFEIIKPRLWKNAAGEQIWLSPSLRLQMVIRDQGVLDHVNYKGDEMVWRYTMNLAINDNQQLDFGPNKNLDLGRLRAAIGQNTEGVRWSIMNIKNCRPFGIQLTHQQKEGSEFINERITKWFEWRDVESVAA